MIYECTNAYYFRYLNKIGGIESHLRYLGKRYSNDYDLVVFYKKADQEQLNELRKHITCIQIDEKDFVKCEVLFCCFNREILSQCEAKKKYLVLHGDYKSMVEKGQLNMTNLPIDERVDGYLGVSKLVCDSWEEITGIKAKNVYEPIVLNKKDKCLMFVSATRLTPEKGWERMKHLADVLNENNVNFQWFIYSNVPKDPRPNMVFLPPRLDITDKLSGYDAFIQLSDNEGFCLSIVEALMNGVPVIATELPVLKELGLNKSNSILLPFDMGKIPLDEIKNITEKSFSYKPPKDHFDKFMVKGKAEKNIRLKATNIWQKRNLVDGQLGRVPKKDEEWEVTKERFYVLRKYEETNRVRLVYEIDKS